MLSELDRTPVIKHLLIINVLVFLVLNIFSQQESLYYLFARFYVDSPHFKIWQIFTSALMHYDLMHLVGNMFLFVFFGMALEKSWGSQKFLIYCITAAIGGSFFTFLYFGGIMKYGFDTFFPISIGIEQAQRFSEFSSIGFSAVSSAIMAASAYLFPSRKLYLMFIPIGIPAIFLVGFYMLEDLYLGVRNLLSITGFINVPIDNVGHFAHLGGAFFGVLLIIFWQKNRNSFY